MKLQQPCATLPREGANSNGKIPTDEIGRESSWRHLRMALFLLQKRRTTMRNSKLILHIPHSSTVIPEAYRHIFMDPEEQATIATWKSAALSIRFMGGKRLEKTLLGELT